MQIRSMKEIEGITFLKTDSSRHALAIMAANFYDNPSEKLTLVGITGTNGKRMSRTNSAQTISW